MNTIEISNILVSRVPLASHFRSLPALVGRDFVDTPQPACLRLFLDAIVDLLTS